MKVTLVLLGYGYSRGYKGYYPRYKVLIDGEPIENRFTKEELKKLPYWVPRSRVMAVTVWGMSREFEAKVALGKFFGWIDSVDNWEKFNELIESNIKVIK